MNKMHIQNRMARLAWPCDPYWTDFLAEIYLTHAGLTHDMPNEEAAEHLANIAYRKHIDSQSNTWMIGDKAAFLALLNEERPAPPKKSLWQRLTGR